MVPDAAPRPELPSQPVLSAGSAAALLEFSVPNLITLLRLLLVPLAVWLILAERFGTAFWVFVAAGASDALDGYIAKSFDQRTRLGALLDPAADKALLAGVYVTLGLAGQLPGWLVILVILRDFLIVLGFVVIQTVASPSQLGPIFISKLNTLMQIALVGFVLARLGLGVEANMLTWVLIVVTGTTTVLSGLSYLLRWLRILAGSEGVL
jgi:cardiolipin synthase (CMP-forming)